MHTIHIFLKNGSIIDVSIDKYEINKELRFLYLKKAIQTSIPTIISAYNLDEIMGFTIDRSF